MEKSYLKERDEQYKKYWEQNLKQQKEPTYTMESCTGKTVRVPESKLESFKKREVVLKQAMDEGWKPGTPLPEKYISEEQKKFRAWAKEQRRKEAAERAAREKDKT